MKLQQGETQPAVVVASVPNAENVACERIVVYSCLSGGMSAQTYRTVEHHICVTKRHRGIDRDGYRVIDSRQCTRNDFPLVFPDTEVLFARPQPPRYDSNHAARSARLAYQVSPMGNIINPSFFFRLRVRPIPRPRRRILRRQRERLQNGRARRSQKLRRDGQARPAMPIARSGEGATRGR